MYVEISGRMTGKTSRLIQAYKACSDDKKAIITDHPRCIFRNDAWTYPKDEQHVVATSRQVMKLTDNHGEFTLFCDDFDGFAVDCTNLIKEGDYFCTTPNSFRSSEQLILWAYGEREDMLLDLVHKIGKDNVSRFVWLETPNMKRLKSEMNTHSYILQYLAEYQFTVEQAMEHKNGIT